MKNNCLLLILCLKEPWEIMVTHIHTTAWLIKRWPLWNSWRRKWQPTPVFLPGKPHWQRSLVGYSLRGHKELDMTEWLHCHFWNSSDLESKVGVMVRKESMRITGTSRVTRDQTPSWLSGKVEAPWWGLHPYPLRTAPYLKSSLPRLSSAGPLISGSPLEGLSPWRTRPTGWRSREEGWWGASGKGLMRSIRFGEMCAGSCCGTWTPASYTWSFLGLVSLIFSDQDAKNQSINHLIIHYSKQLLSIYHDFIEKENFSHF